MNTGKLELAPASQAKEKQLLVQLRRFGIGQQCNFVSLRFPF
jgi:hypothetical protein